MRGNLFRQAQRGGGGGSIPALAGEPFRAAPRLRQKKVYPRACGGTTPGGNNPEMEVGLSPRLRGNQLLWEPRVCIPRSIPALAGEPRARRLHCGRIEVYPRACGGTRGQWRFVQAFPVYPRACGGTVKSLSAASRSAGLSPRLRGNRRTSAPSHFIYGSIPALAGEPKEWITVTRCHEGLSPRLRGNPLPRPEPGPPGGSIPALAGEPLADRVLLSPEVVYPRACGGTLNSTGTTFGFSGLSPRLRGNPMLLLQEGSQSRSIPALAGEPAENRVQEYTEKVYPRACGGTPYRGRNGLVCQGLSPRLRGNRYTSPYRGRNGRSIPALAGEPSVPMYYQYADTVYPRACGGTLVSPPLV